PLVTLTGPGGVGKTRLALSVADVVAAEFADGVVFVPLESLRDPAFVMPTIAKAFGLSDTGGRPLTERLVVHLRPRQVLLVLDNVEQVVEAAPRIAELLHACPHLKVLATSRVVLRLSAEHDVPIFPLASPSVGDWPSLANVASFPAVQLFVARARAASPAFALTPANAAAVAAICARLDGLPLALELAAVRIPTLPPGALLARLERALPLLTGGARDQPDRLRTMRTAIAWSYDLLGDEEQRLFWRLAVFAGGFGLDAAEYVAEGGGVARREAESGDTFSTAFRLPPSASVLDGLTSLVDASLVCQVAGPLAEEPRYQMLETVREFGIEQLTASGEEREVRAAHAAYFLSVVETARDQLFAPGYEHVVERLEVEHDNVRAALVWAETAGESEFGLRLARAMAQFWTVRG
ncbi:MAG: ATP-binding protein, partial [Dehalococcoidia bacterium]